MRKRGFEYFEPNTSPPASGVTILEQLNLTDQQLTTQYRIRYDCCNTTATMTHKSIYYRQKRDNKRCRLCTLKDNKGMVRKRLEARKPIVAPAWPVPVREFL